MKHIFEIKDFIASAESAKNIMDSQIAVLLKAIEDIDIAAINVFVNAVDTNFYSKPDTDILVNFIPTLRESKKNKISGKQSFAAFHNFIANAIAPQLNAKDVVIHIIDGSLEFTDGEAEFDKCKTRIGEMITDVHDMMDLFGYPIWFNTASDKGNYKFGHYYTNIDLINIDESLKLESLPECIMFSGNSNLDWIMVDTNRYNTKKYPSLMMNGEYEYDFLSIKQLIAKFVNFEEGYFDNMFPTVPTEVGSYFRNNKFDRDLHNYDMTNYKENLAKYQKNLKEYNLIRACNVNDVVKFVQSRVADKLSDSDKQKLSMMLGQ